MFKLPSQSWIRQPPLLQGPYNPAPALSQTAETRSTLGHLVQTVHSGTISTSALMSAYSTNIPPLYQHRSSPISQNIVNSRLSHQGSLNEHFLSQHQPDYGNPLPDRMHLAQQNIMPYISSQRFVPSSHLNYQSVTPIGHQPLDQNIGYQPQVALSPQHVGTTFDNNQIRARHSSPQYQPKINHPKPATFDGSQSWQDHLVQFDLIATLNQWTEPTKALQLAASLRGQAQGVLSDLDPVQRMDYSALVTALTDRFKPDNQMEVFRAQLKSRLRTKGESLSSLAQDIKKLVRKAYSQASPEMKDKFAKESFIDALNDQDLEWTIFQGHPSSLPEAIRLAHEYEAFKLGRGRRMQPGGRVRFQSMGCHLLKG